MRVLPQAAIAAFGLALAALPPSASAQDRGAFEKFCAVAPTEQICPTFPRDQRDFSSNFEYMNLIKSAQDPFDYFAWQAFVALNWPATDDGNPMAVTLGAAPEAPRVWQAFKQLENIFGGDTPGTGCPAPRSKSGMTIEQLHQSDGTVLVDISGNFVVYDTRLNEVAADYVAANGLATLAGQLAAGDDARIAFPQGRDPPPGDGSGAAMPSVMIKTAWRVLADAVPAGTYFTRPAVIHVPARAAHAGLELCLHARLGLVGMHIIAKTASGNGDEWIWATFEHVDNAPTAANTRSVNSIYDDELFPGGCTSPNMLSGDRHFAFFDPDCRNCRTNLPPEREPTWADRAPFARDTSGRIAAGAQVVRCWDIFESTKAANERWHSKLRGTVWANYMLVSTQWRGAAKSPLFEHGEVPRFLTNTVLETYLQFDRKGTCLGCHATATTAAGQPSDFTFSLRHAR